MEQEAMQSLRNLLHSEMNISQPEHEEAEVTIRVQNAAPVSSNGGDVVFLGVGLRILDGRENFRRQWVSIIKKSRPSDRLELRQRYSEGSWIGGGESFPAVTLDEQSHGEVLFPGESVLYEMKIPSSDLPYLDIRVEGSVSRRHLFRVVQSMEQLKLRRQPLVIKTFRDLNAIDFYQPLLAVAGVTPELGPRTTLADIEAFRVRVESAIAHIREVSPKLNTVYHSAPNPELRDYMKKSVGQYLTLATEACNKTLKALSSGDTKQMRGTTEELKSHLLTAEKVKRGQKELMSLFGVDPDDIVIS